MKIKSIYTAKETVIRLKKAHRMGENTSDKELISRIYREFKNPNSQRINDPMKEWVNELNRAFSKEEVQMAKNT
jgi:hypothetical protein